MESQARSKRRSDRDGLVDRLSDLPDSLREYILEFLPLDDAVKTKVLSRKWRRTWTKMGRLVFDESVVKRMGSLTESRFTRIIERILLAHQGTLKEFIVHIPDSLRLNMCTDGWFISLARKEVQHVEILRGDDPTHNCKLYSMPYYFFDCVGLTHLYLSSCVFTPPPSFQGFPNLVCCCLEFFDTSSDRLAEFISSCPRIEILELAVFLDSLSEPLSIDAPNLKSLYLRDDISGMINLKNAPRLTSVSLHSHEATLTADVQHRKKTYSSFELISSLAKIKKLAFGLPLLEPLEDGVLYPSNLGHEFVVLKTLTLDDVNICSLSDISFINCLLSSSPNLKTLNIVMNDSETEERVDKDSVEYLEMEGKKGLTLSKLVTVTFVGITGLKSETMLISIMLSSCPVLKTLTIEASKKIKKKAEKMAWELNRCRRLSRDVEVVYSASLF